MAELKGNQGFQPTKRGRAALELIDRHYRAELAEVLLGEQVPKAGLVDEHYEKRTGKKHPPSVAQVMAKMAGEMSKRERQKLARRIMTTDMRTGNELSAREKLWFSERVNPGDKLSMVERTEMVRDFTGIFKPRWNHDPKDELDAFRWLSWVAFQTTGTVQMVGPDGRPIDEEPPEEPEPTPPPPTPTTPVPSIQPLVPIPFSALRFRLETIHCVDPTNGERGADEISHAGVATNGPLALGADPSLSNGVQLPIQDEGQFNLNTVRDFLPGKLIHAYSLNGITMPHLFVVFFAMAEIDSGARFQTYVDELFISIEAELTSLVWLAWTTYYAFIVGGGIVGWIAGGPWGAVVGLIAGSVIGGVLAVWIATNGDEIFNLGVADLVLDQNSLTGYPFFGNQRSQPITMTLRGDGGRYDVTYHWLLTGPIAAPTPGDQDSPPTEPPVLS